MTGKKFREYVAAEVWEFRGGGGKLDRSEVVHQEKFEEILTLNIALQIEMCGGNRRVWRTVDYLVYLVDVHPVAVEQLL